MRDIGAQWLGMVRMDRDEARHAKAFGLTFPLDPDGDDIAQWLALLDLGLTTANIVAEPRYRHSAAKANRDADLNRPTIHLAPLWRHPIDGEEDGIPALILPVSSCAQPAYGHRADTLSRSQCESDDAFAALVSDLIAMPSDGSRALSLTGHTIHVGPLDADDKGRLVLHASGKAWLDAHIHNAARIAADTLPHLVEQLHVPFPQPGQGGALLIEPLALEWRIQRFDCAIPETAREIVCPDSRRLAELIDTQMRKKERVRPLPTVRGPAVPATRIAAPVEAGAAA